jgi:hypothetical protein
MAATRCEFPDGQRPFIWIEAPDVIPEPFLALVDTGCDSTVNLPRDSFVRPVTSSIEGLSRRSTGEQTPTQIITTTIVLGKMSKSIPVAVSATKYAIVGVQFLEVFQQTLVYQVSVGQLPVAILVDNQQFSATLKSLTS